MKKIFYLFIPVLILFSCEIDNYDEPDARISGMILDHNGRQVQTEHGGANMRIKLIDLNWNTGSDDVAVTPLYFNVHQEGTYVNNKVFSSEYLVSLVEGPFYPMSEEESVKLHIKGNVSHDFRVIPYLDLEWVQEPVVTTDNHIKASVRFKRNSKAGVTMPSLLNGQLFISTNQYSGNNNYDSQLVGAVKIIRNDDEGQVIEFQTIREVKYTGRNYYVRIGICCNDSYKKYNYTDIKKLTVN